MREMFIVAAVLCVAVIMFGDSASAAEFGGYQCKGGCSGHAAGYRWAEAHGIDDPTNCPLGHGESFYEGCLVYTEDPSRGSDEDDDGDPI